MRTVAVIIALLAAIAGLGAAESVLLVNSVPLGAEVLVNGTPVGTTPVVLRGLAPGEVDLELLKPGHRPVARMVTIEADSASVVEVELEADAFVATLSARRTRVDGQELGRQESRLVLPAGTWSFESDGTSLVLNPVYPHEGAIAAARIATIVGLATSILATVEDVLLGRAESLFPYQLPTPSTIAAWTATAAAGGFWWALAADRRSWLEARTIRTFDRGLTAAESERLYEDAELALGAGNLAIALAGYTAIVAEGGDSEYVPQSLYKAAQIYGATGETRLAARLYRILIADYPAPDVYDRCLKALADIAAGAGDTQAALDLLDLMVFVDPLHSREEIEAQTLELRGGAR